ncbi:MAG: hypothetical protein A2583_02545 [Bdellovibrionales bacterium RIFOXYD1_FULL_53_11]|nr:MAG: hypothetical protein A2583_02545 [Bdellovibrionales bacterium RIFOXYD1_FULL_53_11]
MKSLRAFSMIFLFSSLVPATSSRALEISFEEDHSLPVVYINLAVKSGGASDPRGQLGITNFLGEMLMRGTMTRDKARFDLELDRLGARMEADTRTEALIMRAVVLSENTDALLALFTESVLQPAFEEKEIAKLKSEITSAILDEMGRDASLAARHFMNFLFESHPYGNPLLGTMKDVQSLSREQILQHFDRLFCDQQFVAVGSGACEEDKISDWARNLASSRAHCKELPPMQAPKDAASLRVQIIDKPDRTQAQVYGGQVGITYNDDLFFPLYVANNAFGGRSFSARMMNEIRVKRGWSYGAFSSLIPGKFPRAWFFTFYPTSKNVAESTSFALKMISDVREKGLTGEEFDFARQSLVSSSGFMYNTPSKRVENKLNERILGLPDGFYKSFGNKISNVTLEDANKALKSFLKPDKLAISILATSKDIKPALAKNLGLAEDKIIVTKYTEEK